MPRSQLVTVIKTTMDDGTVEYSMEDGTPIGRQITNKKASSSLITPSTPEKIREDNDKKIAAIIADPDAILAKNKGENE